MYRGDMVSRYSKCSAAPLAKRYPLWAVPFEIPPDVPFSSPVGEERLPEYGLSSR